MSGTARSQSGPLPAVTGARAVSVTLTPSPLAASGVLDLGAPVCVPVRPYSPSG